MLSGVDMADVIDTSRRQDGIWFVPALFDFEDGEGLSRVDFFTRDVLADDRFRQVERRYSVDTDETTFWLLWLRARLMAEFRVQPLIAGDTSRTSILDIGFVAVVFDSSGPPTYHPFLCVDEVGDGAALLFLTRATPPLVQNQVASAFRSLLLNSALDLATFADYCVLDGDMDSYFVKLGLEADRRFFEMECVGSDYLGGEPGWNDGHSGLPGYEARECDQCDGLGEEPFFPAGVVCETCAGSGRVSWVDPWEVVKRKRVKTAFRDPRTG
jgi:hypothetical protein